MNIYYRIALFFFASVDIISFRCLLRVLIWEDGSLEIRNVTRDDEGRYTCFAENDRGKANSTGSLVVTGKFQLMSNAQLIMLFIPLFV